MATRRLADPIRALREPGYPASERAGAGKSVVNHPPLAAKTPEMISISRCVKKLSGRQGAKATPYPSEIIVSGMTNGTISDVNVTLNGFNHTYSEDVDVLLVVPHLSLNAIILSDVGGSTDAVNLTVTLDDQAAASVPPTGALVSGTFKPTNNGGGDAFPIPAPIPSGNSLLSVFNGQDPNGTWQLYIVDDANLDTGNLSGGWTLKIRAEVDI